MDLAKLHTTLLMKTLNFSPRTFLLRFFSPFNPPHPKIYGVSRLFLAHSPDYSRFSQQELVRQPHAGQTPLTCG